MKNQKDLSKLFFFGLWTESRLLGERSKFWDVVLGADGCIHVLEMKSCEGSSVGLGGYLIDGGGLRLRLIEARDGKDGPLASELGLPYVPW